MISVKTVQIFKISELSMQNLPRRTELSRPSKYDMKSAAYAMKPHEPSQWQACMHAQPHHRCTHDIAACAWPVRHRPGQKQSLAAPLNPVESAHPSSPLTAQRLPGPRKLAKAHGNVGAPWRKWSTSRNAPNAANGKRSRPRLESHSNQWLLPATRLANNSQVTQCARSLRYTFPPTM